MFNRIRVKFVLLSMSVLFILLAFIIAGMNIINYRTLLGETDAILDMMSDNKGTFPPFAGRKLPPFMTLETPFETRYFSVLINEQGEIINADISKITSVDNKKAHEYASLIMNKENERGVIEKYRYIKRAENGLHRITFLDIGRKLYSFQTFLKTSIAIGIVGYLAFFIILIIFSKKIIRPIAESYEKQKRFITDAGHEIKTPLAIIKADAEVIGLDIGENEWLDDIQKQIKRLSGLTNDLVYLSRMEEEEKEIQMLEFPFSDVVQETVSSFEVIAKTQNKHLVYTILPMLSFYGNEKAIRQLINILMDNALKYSPENGFVSVDVKKQKNIIVTVYNTTSAPISKDKLEVIFERFYRIDASRSTMTGGYGIGLSVAKAIVGAHNGKIYATSDDDYSLKIVVSFPV